MNNSIHAPGASWEAIRAARARREALKQKPGPKKGSKQFAALQAVCLGGVE